MIISKQRRIAQKVSTVDSFGGYSHNPVIDAGEFFDMENLSSDYMPLISPRRPRGVVVSEIGEITGMVWLDGLWYSTGQYLVHGEQRYNLGLTAGEKKLVAFGAYIIILPDKKYLNTADTSDSGSIDDTYRIDHPVNPPEITYSLCDAEGNAYKNNGVSPYESDTPPSPLVDGMYWLDTSAYKSTQSATLKRYSANAQVWNEISPTYLRIALPGYADISRFSAGDCITISGYEVGQAGFIKGITKSRHFIVAINNGLTNDIIIQYPISRVSEAIETEDLTISRAMPIMDFVFEHDNRLWGCRYGDDGFGKFVNDIYASALGDFKNWYSFAGLSTDSYAMSCGTDGKWTGAAEVGGYPCFFKERYLHKIYGDYPAQYTSDPVELKGVQEGCYKSMAVVNGVLYYKSRSGICRYDGSLPVEISGALGEEVFTDGVGGVLGNKYYVCLSGKELFVYDTRRRVWHREDELPAAMLCSGLGDLYAVTDGGKDILSLSGNGSAAEDRVTWYCESGNIGTGTAERKRLQRIDVRMSVEVGVRVRIYAEYDSSGVWEPLATYTGIKHSVVSIPCRPRRCDHLRIKITGDGEAKIYSITYITENGSDLK